MERIGWPGSFPLPAVFIRAAIAGGLDHSAVRRFRQRAADQRALQDDLGGWRRRLSVAFDMPTLMGRDSDDAAVWGGRPLRRGDRLRSGHGPAVRGIDLGAVTTSMTISGPAVPIFCMYLGAAERQGVDITTLNGTLQTDIFKEYIAQKEWLFPPGPHLR
jgi:methylmalonyl-CoA mutase N-terminal domain/subunit